MLAYIPTHRCSIYFLEIHNENIFAVSKMSTLKQAHLELLELLLPESCAAFISTQGNFI